MDKETFIKIIKNLELAEKNILAYDKFGIDLHENKYSVVTPLFQTIDLLFSAIYTEIGVDWINWFMYEKDFGKDENMKAYKANVEICRNVEELYDLVNQYKIIENG